MNITLSVLSFFTLLFLLTSSQDVDLDHRESNSNSDDLALRSTQSTVTAVTKTLMMREKKSKKKKVKKGKKKEESLQLTPLNELGGPCLAVFDYRCATRSDTCVLKTVQDGETHQTVNTNLTCDVVYNSCKTNIKFQKESCNGTCIMGPPVIRPQAGDNCTFHSIEGCSQFDSCREFPGGDYQPSTFLRCKCNGNVCSSKCVKG